MFLFRKKKPERQPGSCGQTQNEANPLSLCYLLIKMILRGANRGRLRSSGGVSSSSSSSSSPVVDVLSSSSSNGTLMEYTQKPLGLPGIKIRSSSSAFNDPSTADVVLRLYLEPSNDAYPKPSSVDAIDQGSVLLYLHSNVLQRCKYFAALLSDRWQRNSISVEDSKNSSSVYHLNLEVSLTFGFLDTHVSTLQLLYSTDLSSVFDNPSTALSILPVALELLFEDCVKACIHFLEAVPWSEEEEKRILDFIPLLKREESQGLLARFLLRVLLVNKALPEDMFHGLIVSVVPNHSNVTFKKGFVAELMRGFSSRDSVKRVLDQAFDQSLKIMKESMVEYSSSNFSAAHNDPEALHRVTLHTAEHLLWLVERMIELRVAGTAVNQWSDQDFFLHKAFRDENACKDISSVILRCTCRLRFPSFVFDNPSTALSILPVALELLSEDCVKACIRFLEAVPWSEEEEKRVLDFIPLLKREESQGLLARFLLRVLLVNKALPEDIFHGLIVSVVPNHSNVTFEKGFVAELLRGFSSRDSVKRVLDQAFDQSLKIMKESMVEYSSSNFSVAHNDPEALHRVTLHTAEHLLWLVERMIELRVAGTAVNQWSDQDFFLHKAFRDDNACRDISSVILRCTCRLVNAIAGGLT